MAEAIEKVCLVEDDPTIRELVGDKLRRSGYEASLFDSAEEVLKVSVSQFDLFVVDVMLQGAMTGIELCQRLRGELPQAAILILSALSESSDRIEGLKAGADDYLGKPFEMEELLLRVRAMLRRKVWYRSLPQGEVSYSWANYEINFESYRARSGNHSFILSQKECMLLKLLVEREGQVVTREEILDSVWGYNAFPSTRTVDNFVLRLRKYFDPKYIQSVRGVGYLFTQEGKVA